MKTKTKRSQQRPAKKCETISSFRAPDHRPITITGKLNGVVVATDKADTNRLADRIAASWRDSGWEVEISTIVDKTTLPVRSQSTLAPSPV